MKSNLRAISRKDEKFKGASSVSIVYEEYETIEGTKKDFYKVYVTFKDASLDLRLRKCFPSAAEALNFYTSLIAEYC